jgi:hypothetical protein
MGVKSQLSCSKRGDYGCCRGCLGERWTGGKTNALETGTALCGFLSGEVTEAVIFSFCVVALRVVEGCCGRIGEVSGTLLPPEIGVQEKRVLTPTAHVGHFVHDFYI